MSVIVCSLQWKHLFTFQEKTIKMPLKEIDLNNPVFRAFVFWSTVLLLKMMGMSVLTALNRFRKKVSYTITITVAKRLLIILYFRLLLISKTQRGSRE